MATLGAAFAQGVPERAEKSELATYFLLPTRIVWTSGDGVRHPDTLLQPGTGQATLNLPPPSPRSPGCAR